MYVDLNKKHRVAPNTMRPNGFSSSYILSHELTAAYGNNNRVNEDSTWFSPENMYLRYLIIYYILLHVYIMRM